MDTKTMFMAGATSGAGTPYPSVAPEFNPVFFQWGSCYSIFSFKCLFCRSLFVLVTFFFCPLCCMFFIDVRILITSLWYLQTLLCESTVHGQTQERLQDFKLGGALKKIAPCGGRRENFWSISCEKSRFYAKKSYFFQFQGGRSPGARSP